MKISNSIFNVGANDRTQDLFEGQYIVPNGMAYNSYIIIDDKIALLDTVDNVVATKWIENIKEAVGDRAIDYLIVSHMEPDHSSNIQTVVDMFPNVKILGNAKTFQYMKQFFGSAYEERQIIVKDGDKLELGSHTLNFTFAPMVHWPEVMVSYEETEKVLFSADAFGKFGASDADEAWDCEARRYYFNIVGKYGQQVQMLFSKLAKLDIQTICPLHGPVLMEDLGHYLNLYNTWSNYDVESEGVFIAYASVYGNTKTAVMELAEMLKANGCAKVAMADLAREDIAEALEDAFRYGKVIFAAPTYNAGVFPAMEDFLHHLKAKNYQKRKVAIIENGTWAPMAARSMRAILETMKEIEIIDPVVTIKSAMTEENKLQLQEIAKQFAK